MNEQEVKEHLSVQTRVRRAVRELGDTPDEIAKSLEKRGIRGAKGDPRTCPVAQFLDEEVNDGFVFSVLGASVKIKSPSEVTIAVLDFSVRSALNEFTTHFDKGHFPDLIKEEER